MPVDPASTTIPATVLLDAICDEFERARGSGDTRPLENWLPADAVPRPRPDVAANAFAAREADDRLENHVEFLACYSPFERRREGELPRDSPERNPAKHTSDNDTNRKPHHEQTRPVTHETTARRLDYHPEGPT